MKNSVLLKAWSFMCSARAATHLLKENRSVSSKYVHATAHGHEALQIALGMQLLPQDILYPYYRDDALLLALSINQKDLFSQLLARSTDPFSGGRSYYAHVSANDGLLPFIPHQSSGTGMQAIPAAGAALGLKYREMEDLVPSKNDAAPLVVCSIGDGALSEGEVSEALQFSDLKSLPILFVIQDNQWCLSAKSSEVRGTSIETAFSGYRCIDYHYVDGSDFQRCYLSIEAILSEIRTSRKPVALHAEVPLLGNHTSAIQSQRYRDDMDEVKDRDPMLKLAATLLEAGIEQSKLDQIRDECSTMAEELFWEATKDTDPKREHLESHVFYPSGEIQETPFVPRPGSGHCFMVEHGMVAMRELLEENAECLVYGQDVGSRLGGVFGATANLEAEFGSHRVFNTPLQEAFIIGSTAGLSVAGCRPIVEIQFADFIWLGLNQLFSVLSRSCYLTAGKWPVSAVIRVATGGYGGSGPYHSSSIESVLTSIVGIKVVFPSCGCDLFGLLRAAFYDPNPVVVLEHKALYWARRSQFEQAGGPLPDPGHIIPLGKAKIVAIAEDPHNSVTVVTYGYCVHLALKVAEKFTGQIEIIDLRTLSPFDLETVTESVSRNGKCLVISEETEFQSFAMRIAGMISQCCFEDLKSGVKVLGSAEIPAIPLNSTLEQVALPDEDSIERAFQALLSGD